MRFFKLKSWPSAVIALIASGGIAWAVNTTLANLSASGAIAAGNLIYVVQTPGAGGVKATFTQVATYLNSLFSGDATVSAGGVVTLKNTGPGATGPLGSTTTTPVVTIDAQGRVTALTSATIAGTVSSITPGGGVVSGITATCTQTAVTTSGTLSAAKCINAQTGTTYTVLDTDRAKQVTLSNAAAIAVTLPQAGAASAFANGWFSTFTNIGTGTATITPTTSTINGAATYRLFSGQSITISSDGTNYQIDPGTNGGVVVSSQTGANYAFVASDFGKLINLSNASPQIPTIAVASALGANWFVQACNQGAGTQTITPTTSTIGGAATYVLPAGSAASPNCVGIVSDGTNYQVVPDFFRTGTGVATAAAITLSGAGGLTTTVANGTSALGTSAIGSAACATAVTTTATNTATTDTIQWGFNGDPTAVTGYVPLTAGMLTIIAYPSANNVNFKVCNNTTSSITPGAITLNWRVLR